MTATDTYLCRLHREVFDEDATMTGEGAGERAGTTAANQENLTR